MRAWTVERDGLMRLINDAQDPRLDHDDAPQVVVAVEATATNFADGLMVDGRYQERPPPPFVPGIEVAGTVVASTDTDLQHGSRIVGLTLPGAGAWAEYAVCDARQVTRLPDDVSAVDAVGLYVNAQTAWFALHHRARLAATDVVLVHAAAGGVGSMAVQLARVAGNRTYGVASAAKHSHVLRLGAHRAFDRDDDWPAEIRLELGDRGVDVVVDPVGGDAFDRGVRALAFEGRLVSVGFASGDVPSLPVNLALLKTLSVLGMYWTRYTVEQPQIVAAAATEIFDLYRNGHLDPCVTSVLPVTAATESLADVRSGRSIGKQVLIWED